MFVCMPGRKLFAPGKLLREVGSRAPIMRVPASRTNWAFHARDILSQLLFYLHCRSMDRQLFADNFCRSSVARDDPARGVGVVHFVCIGVTCRLTHASRRVVLFIVKTSCRLFVSGRSNADVRNTSQIRHSVGKEEN